MRLHRILRLSPLLFTVTLVLCLFTPFARAAAPSEDLALAWAWKSSPKISEAIVSGEPAAPFDPLSACVGVRCNGGWASGTAITGAPDGQTWIVTCRHVTDLGGREVFAAGTVYPARLIATHGSYDLALMIVDAVLPSVTVGEARSGEQVTLKGYGVSYSFDQPRGGIVSGTGSQVTVSVPHGPGDSGAGYISAAGQLVGVLHGGYWNRGSTQSSGTGAGPVLELAAAAPREVTPFSRVSQLPAWGGAVVSADDTTVPISAGPCPGGVCPVEGQSVSRIGTVSQSHTFQSTTVTSGTTRGLFRPVQRLREWNQERPRMFGGGRFRQGGACSTCG